MALIPNILRATGIGWGADWLKGMGGRGGGGGGGGSGQGKDPNYYLNIELQKQIQRAVGSSMSTGGSESEDDPYTVTPIEPRNP